MKGDMTLSESVHLLTQEDSASSYSSMGVSHNPEESRFLYLKRRVYTQADIEITYKNDSEDHSLREDLKSLCSCSKEKLLAIFLTLIPIFLVIKKYKFRQNAIGDIMSGMSAAFLHIPQGLGFGILASLAPVYGLYTSFFPILLYMIFGTSPHVSFGTNAVLALLTATVVDREGGLFIAGAANISNSNVTSQELLQYKVGVAMALSFLVGLILLGMGLLRLGFLTNYLAMSFVGGFTTATAVHILTSQVSKMLNLEVTSYAGAGKVVKAYIEIVEKISDSNVADVIVALVSIAILLAVKIGINERFPKKMKIPVPIDLLIVIVGTLISYLAKFNQRFRIAIVGSVPAGFPQPMLPDFSVLSNLGEDSFTIAVIVFAMTISMAKLCAAIHNYELDDNQELVAYGATNFISSFFQCFPSCVAPPRTMILHSQGSKTTLNGASSAVLMFIVLLAAGRLFSELPIAVLGAMIAVSMKNLLLQVKELPNLWRVSKSDFVIWIVTCLVSILVDLDIGIIVGIGVSVFTVVIYTQVSSGDLVRKSSTEDIYLSEGNLKNTKEQPGIRVFYFSSQLFFANADRFKRQLYEKVFNPANVESNKYMEVTQYGTAAENNQETNLNSASQNVSMEGKVETIHHIIIDCSAMTYVDISGINVLKLVIIQYQKVGTDVFLAKCPRFMLKLLNKAQFFDKFPMTHVFFDVPDAVECASCPNWVDMM